MDIEQITEAGCLAALQPEWEELWERCAAATPFQTPEWLTSWWELFGEGQLSTLAMRAGGRLVGLLPAFVDGEGVLRLVGEGISDYLELIAHPEIAADAARTALSHLARRSGHWERGEFVDLRPGSPLLAAGAIGGIQARAEASIVCPFLECPRSAAEFMAALPHGLARNLRRYGDQLASTHAVRIEQADEGTLGEHLDALFRLHCQRWALKQQSGVLVGDRIQSFHRRVATAMLKRGRLRLYGLRCDDRLRAVQYGFAAHGTAYFYLGGFDPALAHFSPGALLMAHAIREGIDEGLYRVDFLRGDEAYKYSWGSRDRANQRLHLRRAMAGAGDV